MYLSHYLSFVLLGTGFVLIPLFASWNLPSVFPLDMGFFPIFLGIEFSPPLNLFYNYYFLMYLFIKDF